MKNKLILGISTLFVAVLSFMSLNSMELEEVSAQDGAYCDRLFMWRCQLNTTYIHYKKWVPAPDPDEEEEETVPDIQEN